MRKYFFAILLLFPLTSCAGVSSSPVPVETDTTEVIGTPASGSATATQVTLVADLVPSTIYVDPNLGYAFDYPADWTITALPEVPGSTVTIHSWDPETLPGDRPQSEGIPEGGEKLDITPLSKFGLDYEQALPWFREQNAGKTFTEEQVALPSGAPAILFVFEKTEDVGVRCLLTEINGNAILACGLAWDFQFFEPIAFSLRPAE